LAASNEELRNLNQELSEARRAAYNLLEDAQLTEAQLAIDLANMRLLADLAQKLVSQDKIEDHLHHVLNGAIILTKADAGTIQILNQEKQRLEMVASKGFKKSFTNYFEFVDAASGTSCGTALRKKERVFIDFDVPTAQDPDGSLKMHVEEGFLSAQSTPLITHSGKVLGMVTTHFKKRQRPGDRELYFIDVLVRQAADIIERTRIEEVLRESEERLRQFNALLEQQVSERTKELKERDVHITNLNRSLFAMNRELNSLNSELKTFTTIAGGSYRETLRHLYIHLEMIVTQDARNLSNSGRANVRRAQGAVQKMKLLTEDLIAFLKLQEVSSEKEDVDLNKIFQTVLSDFRDKPNPPAIDVKCDPLPSITGSALLLSLLFHHLLDNAIKFRKRDKDHEITFTCRELEKAEGPDNEGEIKNSRYSVITIADNGIGFHQEESEKIFDMFYQSHEKGRYKGSGVGLAICKKIMEMHGGFITAEGVPDEGASFHCYFPANDNQ
jgi:signal transduction histidine kinase